jgi:hypothetical protein
VSSLSALQLRFHESQRLASREDRLAVLVSQAGLAWFR